MPDLPQSRYTPKEYLALERKAPYKSEYLDGQIVAMSGASRAHNRIAANLIRILGNQLLDGPWEAFESDMRARVGHARSYVYPDVVIACENPVFEDAELDTRIDPIVIIEVLSPSTENYDRGNKSTRYRQMESLQVYLIMSQDKPFIEHYIRENNKWNVVDLQGLDATLELSSKSVKTLLSDTYYRVEFPTDKSDFEA